jgi:hypothetical protein
MEKELLLLEKTDSFTITARDNFGNQIPEGGLPVSGLSLLPLLLPC